MKPLVVRSSWVNYSSSMQRVISMADFVRDADRIAKEVQADKTVYRVRSGKRSGVVVLDEDFYEGWLATIELMRQPNWREVLDRGRRDARAGIGITLQDLIKELGFDRPVRTGRKRAGAAASTKRQSKVARRTARSRKRAAQR